MILALLSFLNIKIFDLSFVDSFEFHLQSLDLKDLRLGLAKLA